MTRRSIYGPERLTRAGFTFKPEELKIEIFGSHTHALAIITHLPTGISVEGHDPRIPGSVLAAKALALQLLSKKVEGHEHETFGDGTQDAFKGRGKTPGTGGTPGS